MKTKKMTAILMTAAFDCRDSQRMWMAVKKRLRLQEQKTDRE